MHGCLCAIRLLLLFYKNLLNLPNEILLSSLPIWKSALMFVSWSVPTLFPFNSFRLSSQTFAFLTYLESFLYRTRDKNVISISQTHLLKMLSLFPISVLGTFVLDLAIVAACIYFCLFSSPLFLWVICPFEISIVLFVVLWLCK